MGLRATPDKGEIVRIYGIVEDYENPDIWQYSTVRLTTKVAWVKQFNDTCCKASIGDVVKIVNDKYGNPYILRK